MLLPPDDAALFYRAWGVLLTWVNDQRSIVPRFPRPTPDHPIDPSLAIQIKKVVWAEDTLREQFLAAGAADLGSDERELIASWKYRVSGKFIILKHLQKHSIFMSKDVYGVLGIFTPLAVMFPNVPMYIEAVLLPFRDVIITDGLMQSPPCRSASAEACAADSTRSTARRSRLPRFAWRFHGEWNRSRVPSRRDRRRRGNRVDVECSQGGRVEPPSVPSAIPSRPGCTRQMCRAAIGLDQ